MSLSALPPLLLQFAAAVVLSFVLGLELHSYRRAQDEAIGFGTTRTLTLIGVAGFVLWLLDGATPRGLYLMGLAALAVWLAVDLARGARTGAASAPSAADGGALLPAMIALLAYALGPLVMTQPSWLIAAVLIVAILMLAEKPLIRRVSDAVPLAEGVTLGKFIAIAGLVLPLLPEATIPGTGGLSLARVWLAVVVMSGISYLAYLAHTYAFPRGGVLITGLLGGLYSSTAATVVLARQARTEAAVAAPAGAAAVLATAMMYLRLWLVILALGHVATARALALPFGALLLGSLAVAGLLWRRAQRESPAPTVAHEPPRNPLDLPVALLFAALFVLFAAVTNFVTETFGASGLRWLSFAAGLSDIDPFVLSLLAGHFAVSEAAITAAVLIASGSNNLLKAGYALALSRRRALLPAALWLVLTLLLSLAWTHWQAAG